MHDVEVDEEPDVLTCEFEIRQHLGSMHRQHSLNRFDLYDNLRIHQKVQTVADIDKDRIVKHWQVNLPVHSEAPQYQFALEAHLVRLLEKSRSKARVDSHRSINDTSRNLICFHALLCGPLWLQFQGL